MKRRNFIGAIIAAVGALALPKTAKPAPARVEPTKPVQLKDLYPNGMWVHGNGTGQTWILDPACPRDTIYGFSPKDFEITEERLRPFYHTNSYSKPPTGYVMTIWKDDNAF